VNSENDMNQLRLTLSRLFNPKDSFNYCGEGFSLELCLETVQCMTCNIPEYNEYYNPLSESKIRESRLDIFYNRSRMNYSTGFRYLVAGKSEQFIRWVVNTIINKMIVKLNIRDDDTIVYLMTREYITKKLNDILYSSDQEVKILSTMLEEDTQSKKYYLNILDEDVIKCDILDSIISSVKYPVRYVKRQELSENQRIPKGHKICLGNNKCKVHSLERIVDSYIRNDTKNKFSSVFREIFPSITYRSLYESSMLYFFYGVRKSGLLTELGIIRYILNRFTPETFMYLDED
jgi:hypothetical protein